MYMRYGHFKDAVRIYRFCSKIEYLKAFDFQRLEVECMENWSCAQSIVSSLKSGWSNRQSEIRSYLASKHNLPKRGLSWSFQYYRGIRREKDGKDYILSVTPESEMF